MRRMHGETVQVWAMRLICDPLFGPETDHEIELLTGCPARDIAEAREWHDSRHAPARLAADVARRLDLPWDDPEDILRAALVALEYELSERGRSQPRIRQAK